MLAKTTVGAASDPCGFEHAWATIAYDHAAQAYVTARHTTAGDQSALLQLDGIHDWVSYDAGGFNRPPLEAEPLRIDVFLDNGEMRYIYLYDDFYEETDMMWVWVFRSLTVSTDANGDYLGLHDICASGGYLFETLATLLGSS